jgi:putative ABC transport system permease protein
VILRITLRNLVEHKLRLALTTLAVILGVAFVAGTLVFTDTMSHRFDALFSRIGTGVAVDVRAKKSFTVAGEETPTIPAGLVATVTAVPGVARARGNVSGFTAVVGSDGKVIGGQGLPQLGTSWDPADRDFPMRAGRGPVRAGEVALDEETARRAGYRVGDRVRVLTQGTPLTETIVGVIGSGNLLGTTVTSFDQQTAQRLLAAPGTFTDISITAVKGVSQATLRARVARALPGRYEAITGATLREENENQVATVLSYFRTFLLVFAVISVFVGAFIIFNTFSMLVAQRSHELALLRAIGASRRQVTGAVIGEAIGVGLAGSTLGLAAGVGLAVGLQRLFAAAGAQLGSGLVLTARPVVWSYLVGMLVTVVAAYLPARRAARIPPVAAMRDEEGGTGRWAGPSRSLRNRLVTGSVLTAAGAAAAGGGLAGQRIVAGSPVVAVGAGAAMVFGGVAVLAPVLSRPVVRFLGACYPRLFATPGRIARQNALRNPRRTAATASALMIGLALVSAINVLSSSAKASVVDQVDRTFAADYLVTATTQGGFLPAAPQAALQAAPGVRQVTTIYEGDLRLAGRRVTFIATPDPADLVRSARLSMVAGTASLGSDGVLVDAATARARGWRPGSVLPAQYPRAGQDQRLRVAGVYAQNPILGSYIVALPAYTGHVDRAVAVGFLVTTARAGPAAKEAVQSALGGYPNLKVADQSDVKKQAQKSIDQLVLLLTLLLALSIIIAGLGIINTLALSVIERTREIGLLRAVGVSRRQTRLMIRLESVIIAVFGALLGIAVGVLFGAAIQHSVRDKGLNVLDVPVWTLAFYLALSAVIGVVAAVWPAWRASRLDILRAIAIQ